MKSHRGVFTFSHEASILTSGGSERYTQGQRERCVRLCVRVARDSDERLGSILTKFSTNGFGRKISVKLFYRQNRLSSFKMKKPFPFVLF